MCWQGDEGDDQQKTPVVLNLTAHNLLSNKLLNHSKLEQITTEHPEQICQCISRSKNKTAVPQLQFFDEIVDSTI